MAEHKHDVIDTDPHFRVDPVTRKIVDESSTKTTVVQFDHGSQRFTFELPKEVDKHDMSTCNKVEVHFWNTDGKDNTKVISGVYVVDDLHVSEDNPDVVVLSWLIKDDATQYAGSLRFLIKLKCLDDAGNVTYCWNTVIHSGISVSEGMDNAEAVVGIHTDALEQYKQEIIDAVKAEMGDTTGLPDPEGYSEGALLVLRDGEWIPTDLIEVQSEHLITGNPTIIGAINEAVNRIDQHQVMIEEIQFMLNMV